MPRRNGNDGGVKKRVSSACKRCRKHKIKCSGTAPCKTCELRGVRCEFEADERKVLVSEKYLNSLRGRLAGLEGNDDLSYIRITETPISQAIASAENHKTDASMTINGHQQSTAHDVGRPIQGETPSYMEDIATPVDRVPNPLVRKQPAYTQDVGGKLRYLGHSSTWSFSRQVLELVHQHSPVPDPSYNVEGEAYDLTWKSSGLVDLTGLPSQEVSLYLVQTVKFRISTLFHILDEEDFAANINKLYANPSTYAQTARVWFVHYLLIMAFGKALTSNTQAGSHLFVRALSLLPDVPSLCMEPVEATEVLCSIALYLQCIDHRTAAHIYIGQAVRMAQSFGLHTDMQVPDIGDSLVHRCRRIWWTVCVLDRRLSASVGAPSALRDEDITVPTISGDGTSAASVINVRIGQLLGNVLGSVYSVDSKLDKRFVPTVRTVLTGAAALSDELSAFSDSCFGEVSRVAAHLNLAYHQCIVLTTRPFLFYLLKRRLESGRTSATSPLSSSAKGIVQVCIDSATQIVATLSTLREHDLIDSFLSFDLDSAFSSAFVLILATSVHPKLLPDNAWLTVAFEILDDMISKGSPLAKLRRSEVEELAQMFKAFNQGRPPEFESPAQSQSAPIDHASLPSLGDPFFDEWNLNDGLSGEQIMSLADTLDGSDLADLWLQSGQFDHALA